MKIDKQVVYKKTTDDWYPNFPDDQVKVILCQTGTTTRPGEFRVSVWGGDDFGMEIDSEDLNEAKMVFSLVKEMKIITKTELRKLGFRPA